MTFEEKEQYIKDFFKENFVKVYYEDYRLVVELNEYSNIHVDTTLVKKIGNYIEIRPNLENLKCLEQIKEYLNLKFPNVEFKLNEYTGNLYLYDINLSLEEKKQIENFTKYLVYVKPKLLSNTCRQLDEIYYKHKKEIFSFRRKLGEKINKISLYSSEIFILNCFGGAGEVGRSCYMLKTENSTILLDAGLKLGETIEYPMFDFSNVNIQTIDAIIISHAHLDHGGFLPFLFKEGYTGPVYMTRPTQALLLVQHLDLLKINSANYQLDHIKEWIKHTIFLDYERVTKITPEINIVFEPTNHLLGSCMVYIMYKKKTILFTGDYKYLTTGILPNVRLRKIPVHTLITEATYANINRQDETYTQVKQKIKTFAEECYKNQGHLLIPCFAIGRSQELLLVIHELLKNGELPNMNVFIDGSILETTKVAQDLKKFYKYNLKIDFMQILNDFKFVKNNTDMYQESSIILSTSGMFEGGPIIDHLINLANKITTTIVITNAQITLTGKKIKQGQTPIVVKRNNVTYTLDLNAKIEVLSYFSGHSSENSLLNFIKVVKPLEKVIIIHSEYSNAKIFSKKIKHIPEIKIPKNLEIIRLDI